LVSNVDSKSRLGPVAIAVAPNGGRRTKADHPAIPISVDELVLVAQESHEAGAAMIHVHVRDAEGRHCLNAAAYLEVTRAIRRCLGNRLVVQITSESIGRYNPDEQMAVVKAVRPEAVSLALRELVPDAARETDFAAFLGWLQREQIVPQVILYSADDLARFSDLRQRGLVPWNTVPLLFVLGSYAGQRAAEPSELIPFLSAKAALDHWMVCAFGRREAACVVAAGLCGGHVRVGFENNLQQPDGALALNNAAQVHTVARTLNELGCAIADADQLRAAWAKR
jgi:3-keto-5-aminohexanoate cleavage enzyme